MSKRHYWWSVTIHSVTDDIRSQLKSPPKFIREMWYQDEIAPTTGALHIQGCFHTSQLRFSTLKEWLPTAHIEAAINKDALIAYCSKSATSVEGTFIHYGGANVIVNPEDGESQVDLNLSLNEILLMIASHVHEDEWANFEPKELYDMAVNRLTLLVPHLVDKFTRQNVQSAWKVVNYSYLRIYQQIQNDNYEEEVSQPVSQGECEIFPECSCCKDNCLDCNFWEHYAPDIISLPVV